MSIRIYYSYNWHSIYKASLFLSIVSYNISKIFKVRGNLSLTFPGKVNFISTMLLEFTMYGLTALVVFISYFLPSDSIEHLSWESLFEKTLLNTNEIFYSQNDFWVFMLPLHYLIWLLHQHSFLTSNTRVRSNSTAHWMHSFPFGWPLVSGIT